MSVQWNAGGSAVRWNAGGGQTGGESVSKQCGSAHSATQQLQQASNQEGLQTVAGLTRSQARGWRLRGPTRSNLRWG
jgi:hypothetical protein